MKKEVVFQIGGGGSEISIYRETDHNLVRFLYYHREFDPTDEGLDVNKKNEYTTFGEPFRLIDKKYRWYTLYMLTVHVDYRNYIREKLMERLNDDLISSDELDFTKNKIEEVLDIELTCKRSKDKLVWTYKEGKVESKELKL